MQIVLNAIIACITQKTVDVFLVPMLLRGNAYLQFLLAVVSSSVFSISLYSCAGA